MRHGLAWMMDSREQLISQRHHEAVAAEFDRRRCVRAILHRWYAHLERTRELEPQFERFRTKSLFRRWVRAQVTQRRVRACASQVSLVRKMNQSEHQSMANHRTNTNQTWLQYH